MPTLLQTCHDEIPVSVNPEEVLSVDFETNPLQPLGVVGIASNWSIPCGPSSEDGWVNSQEALRLGDNPALSMAELARNYTPSNFAQMFLGEWPVIPPEELAIDTHIDRVREEKARRGRCLSLRTDTIQYNIVESTQVVTIDYYYNPVNSIISGTSTSCSWVNYNFVTREPTEEEKAASKLWAAEKEQAKQKAEELLLLVLTDTQKEQYKAHGYFETEVNDKIYRIKTGRSGNVELLENGKAKYRYCAHPWIDTPDQDTMLTQLLMLKTDESQFLQIANRTVLY
jgi:hypothetical protein